MSRIDELIAELCPAGVPFYPMWQLTIWDKRFNAVDHHKQPRIEKYRYLLAKELSPLTVEGGDVKILTTNESDLWSNEELIDGPIHEAEIVAIPWGGNAIVQHYSGRFVTSDNRIAVANDPAKLDMKFLYYFMTNNLGDLGSFYRGSGIKHPSMAKVLDWLVPLPPLEVQREIVRILDTFSALEAELEAELEARKQQYEHYRAKLVDQSQDGPKLSLGEIENRGFVKLGRGKVISKTTLASSPGDYPVYSSSGAGTGEFGRYGEYMFDDERITWSVDGGGRFFYRHPHRFSVTNVSGWMTIDGTIFRVKYLYYVLTTQWEKQTFDYTRKAHPSVIRDVYSISIPPLEEQDRVVSVLDKFEALVNDLSVGLPAELAARRQQYEFYRDRLLTFEELPA